MPVKTHNNAWKTYTQKGFLSSGLLWLTPEEKQKYRLSAFKAGRSQTQHLRKIVTEYLEKEKC